MGCSSVRAFFDCCRWTGRVDQPLLCTPLWPASWLSAVDKSRGSKSVEVQRVWEVYDERLQYMSRQDAFQLDESLASGDISRAWLVWSGAAQFRVVRLGESKVRKARGNVSDVGDAAGVFLYRDSSIARLLDMRRRFSAVLCVLDAMLRWDDSLARSVELPSQWDKVLAIGPSYPVTNCDLAAVQGLGIGGSYEVVSGLHRRLCDFIHAVVVHRRDDAIRGLAELGSGGSFGSSLQMDSS